MKRVLGILLLAALATGCSTSNPESIAQNDPLEPTNRVIFDMNMKTDNAVAKPVAKFYNRVVPQFARNGIHNALTNLNKPVVLGNDILQGDGPRAGQTVGRFAVNTTLGLGGLIDVASMIGIPDHTTDFGITLGTWGVAEGPYVVVPFLGPNPPRDMGGEVVDFFMDPTTWIRFHGSATYYAVIAGANVLDYRARNVDTVDQIERTSIDFYASTRSLYRQYRNAQIHRDKPETTGTDTPEF
jgi:phospholipid-binding lipoprotein MlaA